MQDYSEYEHLKIEVADRVATVTLNRPDRLNAVSSRSSRTGKHLARHRRQPRCQRDYQSGTGRAFCAGGDVSRMDAGDLVKGKRKRRFDRGAIVAANGRRVVENMLDVEQPIIGAINGDAIGLGAT